MKQSNLSRAIKSIEYEFGTALFTRTAKGVFLTAEGREVYDLFEAFIEKKNLLQSKFSNVQKNVNVDVTIAISSILSVNIFTDIMDEYAHGNYAINLVEYNIGELISNIKNGLQTLGFLVVNPPILEKIKIENLLFLPADKVQLIVVARKDSFYAKRYKMISLKELSNMPLVIFKTNESKSSIIDLITNYCKLEAVKEVNSIPLYYSMIKSGDFYSLGTLGSMKGEDWSVTIPLKEKMNLRAGFLIKEEILEEPLLRDTILQYYKFKQLPLPQILTTA